MRLPFGQARRQRDARRRALLDGEPVAVSGRLRRTSARGWGAWTDTVVSLGPPPDGPARWRVDDPIAVGLPSTHGPVSATFIEIGEVYVRPVRFRTEAFWGMDADIVVLTSERGTTELAFPQDLTAPVAARLRELFGLDDVR